MSILKDIFKVFNGSSWDEHYFKTSSDQVVHTKADGTATTVQEELLAQNSTLGNIGKTFQQLVLISGNQEASFDCDGYRFLYLFATCGGKAFTQFIPVSILRNDQETYVFGAAYTTSEHGIWIEIKLSRNKVSLIDAKMNGGTVLAYVYVNGIN